MTDEKADIKSQEIEERNEQKNEDEKDNLTAKIEDSKNKRFNASTISMIVVGVLIAVVAIIIFIPKSSEKQSAFPGSATQSATAKVKGDPKKEVMDEIGKEIRLCKEIFASKTLYTAQSTKKLSDATAALTSALKKEKPVEVLRDRLDDMREARLGLVELKL